MKLPHLLPERIEALLAPDGLHLRRDGGCEFFASAPDSAGDAWRAPLLALDRALCARPPRMAPGAGRLPAVLAKRFAPRLDIVLSEHFTRWQLLPWQAEVDTPAEQDAYAQHTFREVYGEIARHWRVRCTGQAPGAAVPACAIDDELVAALRAVAAAHGCRLGSLRPLFAAAADRWRHKLPRGIAWFGVLERGRLILGLLRDRRWQALHGESVAAPEDCGELLAGLIARSAIFAGIVPAAGRLLLCGEGADTCAVPLTTKTVQRLGSALAWNTAARAGRSLGINDARIEGQDNATRAGRPVA